MIPKQGKANYNFNVSFCDLVPKYLDIGFASTDP